MNLDATILLTKSDYNIYKNYNSNGHVIPNAVLYELLNFGEFGILVENSVDRLYLEMKKILEDKKLIYEYKNKSIERREFFNYEKRIKEIEELFV